jgi:hypothetical protein
MTPLEAATVANETYREKHGHEDPAYLEKMLTSGHRQVRAAQQVVRELYERWQVATVAEWEAITDAEVMSSEHLRKCMIGFADRERWAADRMRSLGPKTPLGRFTLHDESKSGEREKWLPTIEFYTLERHPSAEQQAQTADAIRELGQKWAFGRRLIKFSFMCPDLGEIGSAVWIEYEPATEQGRVMTKGTRYSDAEQLVYGPVEELLSAAIDHVELLKGSWNV